MEGLDRERIIDGLREVIRRAESAGVRGIQLYIVGGAALALHYFERDTTRDIDARFEGSEELSPLVDQIANDLGWTDDWLNDDGSQFVPYYGDTIDWVEIYRGDSVTVYVAPPDVLLAMKLNAYERRTDADADDIEGLIPIVGITSVDEADELVERYFPGDSVGVKTERFLRRIFSEGVPATRPTPPQVTLEP